MSYQFEISGASSDNLKGTDLSKNKTTSDYSDDNTIGKKLYKFLKTNPILFFGIIGLILLIIIVIIIIIVNALSDSESKKPDEPEKDLAKIRSYSFPLMITRNTADNLNNKILGEGELIFIYEKENFKENITFDDIQKDVKYSFWVYGDGHSLFQNLKKHQLKENSMKGVEFKIQTNIRNLISENTNEDKEFSSSDKLSNSEIKFSSNLAAYENITFNSTIQNILSEISAYILNLYHFEEVKFPNLSSVLIDNQNNQIIEANLEENGTIEKTENLLVKIHYDVHKYSPLIENILEMDSEFLNSSSIDKDLFYSFAKTKYQRFRTIFVDTFARLDYIPKDESGVEYKYHTIGNSTYLGKNSFNNTDAYSYKEIKTKDANFNVGVKVQNYFDDNGKQYTNRVVFNQVIQGGGNIQKKIEYVNANRTDIKITFEKGSTKEANAQIAFWIKNISNFYYIKVDDQYLSVILVKEDKETELHKIYLNQNIQNQNSLDSSNLKYHMKGNLPELISCYLQSDSLHIYIADFFRTKIYLSEKYENSTLCGLYFNSNTLSEVSLFQIEYIDNFIDIDLDSPIEEGDIKKKEIQMEFIAEENLITPSKEFVCNSNNSLKFELYYYKDWKAHAVADSRRTEIKLISRHSQPLDSWISIFDIYFPGKKDKDKYYATDKLDELFWQSHDDGGGPGLSPHVAMYLRNDVIIFQTLSRELMIYDLTNVTEQKHYGKIAQFAILVDKLSPNGINENGLIEIEKGKWHNFVIFIKEGYVFEQNPISIIFIDGKKVLDFRHPNAYNCGNKPEYLKMGLYKWVWRNSPIESNVTSRILYYDNIYYLR